MTWPAVRTKLRDLLAEVAIETPVEETVKRVFEFPPAAIEPGNLPCFLLIPPQREQELGPNYSVIRTYTMRVQFLCRDEKVADAVNIADAYAEAVLRVFYTHLRLDGIDVDLNIVQGPNIDEPSSMTYAGQNYVGFGMTLTIRYSQFIVEMAA